MFIMRPKDKDDDFNNITFKTVWIVDLIWRSLLRRHQRSPICIAQESDRGKQGWAQSQGGQTRSVGQAQDWDRDRHSVQFERTRSSDRYNEAYKVLQVATTLCLDSRYEIELEEDPVDEDEDGGGGSIDEFDRVDISEGVNNMHDEDIFEAEEVMDESNIYEWGG